MRTYIAAPFFNEAQLKRVEQIERQLELRGFEYFSPRSTGVIKQMSEEDKTPELMRKMFDKNIEELLWCDLVVADLNDKDVGTAFEVGYAYHMNKPIITFSYKPLNLMLASVSRYHAQTIVGIGIFYDEYKRRFDVSGSCSHAFNVCSYLNLNLNRVEINE